MKVTPNLEAYKDRLDLVFVIETFNSLEGIISEIIGNYISREERANFVSSVVLNNSIVSFGSKIKILLNILSLENYGELDKDALHRVAHIRNQFAHSGQKTVEFSIDLEGEDSSSEVYIMLESLSANGILKKVRAEEALDEYSQKHNKVKNQLITILKAQCQG